MIHDIVLIGGGGHCKSVIDVILSGGSYRIKGILDNAALPGTEILGVPIIGGDENIDRLISEGVSFHVSLGIVNPKSPRAELCDILIKKKAILPIIISSNAYVSPFSSIGPGSIIMHRAVVNAGVAIGANCIINTAAVVEHDSSIGNDCHISTGAHVNGNCVVESGSFIGSNATLIHGIRIGAHNLIGAGSVVLRDTEEESLYAGNPAEFKKTLN